MNFESFLREAGLIPGEIECGRWIRCATESHPRKKNGSYKLAPDGLVGWATNFESGGLMTWRPEGSDAPAKVDHVAIAWRAAQARKALIKATTFARAFYAECKPLRNSHPYLESHRLTMAGCFGLKIDSDGWLVVPVLLGTNVISVQRISPTGVKRFWPGASVKAGSYTVERKGASITVLCEGLATGLAIFACAPLTRIVVCFDAGNMPKVAENLSVRGLVTVAADNDKQTEGRVGANPGLIAAQAAASRLGCGIAIPEGITGTDWCDLRNERFDALVASRPAARDSSLRRAVDAEIAAAIFRNTTFVRRS